MAVNVARIGKRVHALREARGLEQDELAELAGLSQTYVSRLERGLIPNPKLYDLTALVVALGAELTDVIASTGERANFIDQLMQRPELTAVFGRLATGYEQARPEDQDFVLRALSMYAERFGPQAIARAC